MIFFEVEQHLRWLLRDGPLFFEGMLGNFPKTPCTEKLLKKNCAKGAMGKKKSSKWQKKKLLHNLKVKKKILPSIPEKTNGPSLTVVSSSGLIGPLARKQTLPFFFYYFILLGGRRHPNCKDHLVVSQVAVPLAPVFIL